MGTRLGLIVATVLIFITSPACAQNSFLKNLNLGQNSSSPISRLQKTRDDIIQSYLGSTKEFSGALGGLTQAFGLAPQVSSSLTGIQSLNADTLKNQDFEQIRQSLTTTITALKQQLQSPNKLSPQSLQVFITSLASMSESWQKMKTVMPKVTSLVQQTQNILKNAPMQDKMKLQDVLSPGLAMLKNVPSQLLAQKDLLTALSSYASANNIQIPNKAQQILTGLRK